MSALKRILNKDIKSLTNNKLSSFGIFIVCCDDNFYEAKALIKGPKDSLYEGSFLLFEIEFPKNYPFSPPTVHYISRNNIRIHPNLYTGVTSNYRGKVCLSILGTWSGPKWTTIMDISTVLISIQSLLDNNPLHHEPGQENNNTKLNEYYNETIFYESINTLLMKNIIDIPDGFEIFHTIMIEDLTNNYQFIYEKLKQKKENYKKTLRIQIPFYRISLDLNYKILYKKYIEFCNIYNLKI